MRSGLATGSVAAVRCPACGSLDDRVIDSRTADDGLSIRRRRQCDLCAARFTTFERVEEAPTIVIKRDGRKDPFDRTKIEAGVRSACKGRPVDESNITALATRVEDRVSATPGGAKAADVGELVLDELRRVDPIAAVRFASVYKSFDKPEDFEREVQLLGDGDGPEQPNPKPVSP